MFTPSVQPFCYKHPGFPFARLGFPACSSCTLSIDRHTLAGQIPVRALNARLNEIGLACGFEQDVCQLLGQFASL